MKKGWHDVRRVAKIENGERPHFSAGGMPCAASAVALGHRTSRVVAFAILAPEV
jgi:hypothetical protein